MEHRFQLHSVIGGLSSGETHKCPVCWQGGKISRVCEIEGYELFTCGECGADHVYPTPTEAELKAFYDRREWFEGGERGGYQNYDSQTDWSVKLLESLLDKFDPQADLSLLDLGCGYGTYLAVASARGWKCFGVELSVHARGVAQERLGGKAYIVESVADLIPHEFDLVLILDVIEHLASPYALMYHLFSIGAITPRTRVLITTPIAGADAAKQNPAEWRYRRPPSHLVFYCAESLQIMLRRLRFTEITVNGLHPREGDNKGGLIACEGLLAIAKGSDFTEFMRERYVPGTWSKLASYEHIPRYILARTLAGGKAVLDFGCGTGYGAAMLAEVATQVTGLDVDQSAIDWASQCYRNPRLNFRRHDDFGANLPAGLFDIVTCFEMIEHVDLDTQKTVIASIARLLREDGMLVISTPNREVTKLYGENPYHRREMTEVEFLQLLDCYFPYVRILRQCVRTSIAFEKETVVSSLAAVSIRPGEHVSRDNCAAFVALCSRLPIPDLPDLIVLDDEADYVHESITKQNKLVRARVDAYHSEESTCDAKLATARQAEEIHRLHTILNAKDEVAASQAHEIHRLLDIVAQKDLATARQAEEIQRLMQLVEYHGAQVRALSEVKAELENALISKKYELSEQQREVAMLKATHWHRLGLALREKGISLRRAMRIVYHLTACVIPNKVRSRLRPLSNKLRLLCDRVSMPNVSIEPQRVNIAKDPKERRPKVLHVIANFMVGGSSRLVVDLIEGLGTLYEQQVVTSFIPSPPAYEGVDVTEFRAPSSPSDVLPFLQSASPDIVHVHYWGDCDWWWYDIFFRAIEQLGCKVVQNVNTPVEPYKASFIDRYVYVSSYVRNQFGQDLQKNMTIYPGSDLRLFSRADNIELPDDCIGMVYRLENDKLDSHAIDVFIKVIQQRPKTKAIIVGGGSFLKSYKAAVRLAKLEGSIEFKGYVDYQTLPVIYQRMTIFVAPVWKESFGQVSLFAMNMGIPVVGYAVGGLVEIVDDPSLLATPGNSDELAKIVVELLEDPVRLSAISRRNQLRAQKASSVEAMIDAYRSLYGEVIEAKR